MAKKKQTIRESRGPRPSVFPKYLQTTPKEWRALKRQEWREVVAALDRYHFGADFTPAQAELYKIVDLSARISDELEHDDWVAW